MKKFLLPALALLLLVAGMFWVNYDDWITLPRERKYIGDQMKDPSSAQFRNDRLTKNGWHCGEINAKNSMGAFVGFKRFISSGNNGVFYVDGHGRLGDLSAAIQHEEFMALMDKKIANLKALNELRKQIPDLKVPSESEQDQEALKQLFEDRWEETCA